MKNLTVALLGDGLYLWDGGVDYLLNIANILEYVDANWQGYRINIYLVLPLEHSVIRKIRRLLSKGKRNDDLRLAHTSEYFCSTCKKVTVIYYRKFVKKIYDDRGKSLQKTLQKINADICFPVLCNYYPQLKTPWIGYIPDFQEKYLPEMFDDKIREYRDQNSKKMVLNTRFFLTTSKSVRDDMETFYPGDYEVFSQPFAPVIPERFWDTSDCDIGHYDLPQYYFLISNQFWPHKAHITAFKALKLLHERGMRNIHIVCTGKMASDNRKENYSNKVLRWVKENEMDAYIHFLGFIPKKDQIEIMKHAIAILQPTLFEGDSGGGVVKEGNALQIPVIMSDIKVNREADGCEGITLFRTEDYENLAGCMRNEIEKERENVILENVVIHNRENGEKLARFYMNMIEEVIKKYQPRK